jgi:hypothetical protein
MKVTVEIENVYEDETITVVDEVEVPAVEWDSLDDWAEDYLYPLTGTGRPEGDAGYFLTVTACDDPRLVGITFDWGI